MTIIEKINTFNEYFSKLPDKKVQNDELKEIAKLISQNDFYKSDAAKYYVAKLITDKIAKKAIYYELGITRILKNTVKNTDQVFTDLLLELEPINKDVLRDFVNKLPIYERMEVAEALMKLPRENKPVPNIFDELQGCLKCPLGKRVEAAEFLKGKSEDSDYSRLFGDLACISSENWVEFIHFAKVVKPNDVELETRQIVDLFLWFFDRNERNEIINQAVDLLHKIESAITSDSLMKTIIGLKEFFRDNRPALINVLGKIGKGMSDLEIGNLMSRVFKKLPPDEEWPDIVESSLILMDDKMNSFDRFLMVEVIGSAPFAHRVSIAKITNEIVKNRDQRTSSSEKKLLVKAVMEGKPANRVPVMQQIIRLYKHMVDSYKRELNGPELSRLMKALNLAPYGGIEDVMNIVLKEISAKMYIYEIADLLIALSEKPKDQRNNTELFKQLRKKWADIRIESGEKLF